MQHLDGASRTLGVRIRGIYSTAITRLLLDKGIPVADPTEVIRSRFETLKGIGDAIPATTIKDREDRNGLVVIGLGDLVDRVLGVLRGELPRAVYRRYRFGVYEVYRVRILERAKNGFLVELPGHQEGILLTKGDYKRGETLAAHVVRAGGPRPVLRPGGAIVGLYLRLIEGAPHGVSQYVRDPRRRAELLSIAMTAGIEGWGIRFRSSAAKAGLEQILEEISEIKGKLKKLQREAERAAAPSLLWRGESLAMVVLPCGSKLRLDDIRRRHMPTIYMHHFYKAHSSKYSELVDFLEQVLPACSPTKLAGKALSHYLRSALRGICRYGAEIVHEKLDGRAVTYRCRAGIDRHLIRLERKASGPGTYDGLGVPKEEGDLIVSLTAPFSPLIVHQYYGRGGRLKGTYVNINSPTEVSPEGRIWYVDLGADVVEDAEGNVRVIDIEEVDRALDSGLITEALADHVMELASRVRDSLRRGDEVPSIISSAIPEDARAVLDQNIFTPRPAQSD